MNKLYTLLALALVIGMASCSSSRNAQNTDDIYYSDGTKKASAAAADDNASRGDYYNTAPSDNYVRMKATDPDRWSYFDNYDAYDSYYYSPMGASASFGYGYPAYGLGFGSGLGYGYGLGFGYGMGLWDPYFAWNAWYNPFFYNSYYGGAVFVTSHGLPASAAYGMRPFNSLAYRNGLAHAGGTVGTARNPLYRNGMSSTSAYNSRLSGTNNNTNGTFRNGNNTFRNGNSNQGGYRPVNNNNNFGGQTQTRTYSPPSTGGNSGGSFRTGGGGFRH